MSELEWLSSYEGDSIDELIDLEHTYRVDSIVLALYSRLSRKFHEMGLQELSEEEQTFVAVEKLEMEVNNGGYDQSFVNASKLVPIVEAALSRIGCSQTAGITAAAIRALAIPGNLTQEAVEDAIYCEDEDRREILSKCDQEFYDLHEDIADCLFRYVKENSQGFRL